MVEIYGIQNNKDIPEYLFNELSQQLSCEKISRVDRLLRKEDKERTIIGECLVRTILSKKINKKKNSLTLNTNQYGKPYLVNYPSIHFNISHAGDWIVCAVSSKEVGIDVEIIKLIDYSIVDRFFSQQEIQYFHNTPDNKKLEIFYEFWTTKESYIKAVGMGLYIPLQSFTVDFNQKKIFDSRINNINDTYYIEQFNPDKDYKLAVCSKEYEFSKIIKLLNLLDLLADHD